MVGAILEAIDEQRRAAGESARVTRVALQANLSYDRLQWYLTELERDGFLVREGRMPRLTERGDELLRLYRDWARALQDMGLHPEYRAAPRVPDVPEAGPPASSTPAEL